MGKDAYFAEFGEWLCAIAPLASKYWSLSRARIFATPRTAAYQVPLSMRFFQARILEWVPISSSRGSS